MVDGNGTPPVDTTDEAEVRALEVTFQTLQSDILLARMQFARQAGITFDGLRDEYQILGYPRLITNREYRDEYARGGIAGSIVDVMPDATWRGDPAMELVEDEDPEVSTPFEEAWRTLDTRLQICSKLQRVDKLSRLSNYAVLLIGVAGGSDFGSELPRGTPDKLLYLMPFSGGGGPGGGGTRERAIAVDADASITEYVVDTASPRFGLPLMYQLRRTDVSSPVLQRPVHWSRIIHIAENVLDDEVYGQPALERVWNLLIDLRKVTGGGAEAFWLRANQGLHLDVDAKMALPDVQNALEALKSQAESYKHQLTRWLRTRGVKVETLGSDVANFSQNADAIITQIAGAKRIPKRILTGSEMGELASSQDRENFKDQVNGRQTQYAGPYIVRNLVDRLIRYGYLPTPKKGPTAYGIRWAHMQVLTEQEKADGAKQWASINSTAGMTIFTDAEIRDKWYGMEPIENIDAELWKARLALMMASVNKTQGITVFTDDEIRKTCYGWDPLTPEQKMPIMAPERVSAKAPTPGIDEPGGEPVVPAAVPPETFPRAAQAQAHAYGTTQIQLPPDIAARLLAFGRTIPDGHLAMDGLETDAHITVRYGLTEPDPAKLFEVVARRGPIEVTLGRTAMFAAPDYDVVYVTVQSINLNELHTAIGFGVATAETKTPYIPHATVAYVKPGVGSLYANRDVLNGVKFSVDTITMRDVEGNTTEINLLD